MFFGREKELRKLETMYQSNKLEVAIVYGRRRVGKTTLINEFCKDKRTVFFAALEHNAEQNLEALSSAIADAGSMDSSVSVMFRSFGDAFTRLAEMAENERLVFVIDEYPYLAHAEKSVSSLLQSFLDHQFKSTKLFVILCGSSTSFMENQVLGYQSPLYGRRTAQFKIQPFDYLDTGRWFPDYTFEEKAIMYGVTGGIPMYLEQFSSHKTIKENLLDTIFDRNAILFEEPSNLLKQELRDPANYNAIITAIASGKTKLSEIATTVGMQTGPCTKYINNLISLGILKREAPITEPNSKRPIYLIEDQLFRFWYRFVPRNMADILSGRIEKAYERVVGDLLSDYMGLVFEDMCRDFLLYHDDALPFNIEGIGQWWGGNPKTKKQAQIDIIVTSSDERRSGIVGSCKFTNSPMGKSEKELMEDYAEAMGHFEKRYYYYFSKSGFTDYLQSQADGVNVRLISLPDIYKYKTGQNFV